MKAIVTRAAHFPAHRLADGCLVLGFALLLSARVHAQPAVATIVSNGPAAKRINIVMLSEGYRTNELPQFLADAATLATGLFAESPFSEYTNYFNVFAISVASAESGADRPPASPSTLKNTYFNSTFNSFGIPNLLSIPPNNYDANINNGKGKVLNLLTNYTPDYDLVVLLVNESASGGAGDAGITNNPPVVLVSAHSSSALDTMIHEIGHTLGNLADEYTNAQPGYVAVEKPNATAQTNRALIKWKSWIAESTPVPTPYFDTTYYYDVGLFQGAQYQSSGWYRPKADCMMNHLGQPFCEVCSEQLVRSTYGLAGPIDSFSPVSTNVSIVSTQAVVFSVLPMRPSNHNLGVNWLTNGIGTGVTATNYQFLPGIFGSGTHTVSAVVADSTALVLDDPTQLLKATNTWVLNVTLPQLTLTNPAHLPAGAFRFTVTGSATGGFVIEASTNLTSWTPLSTNSLSGGSFHFTNPAAGLSGRYYRAVTVP